MAIFVGLLIAAVLKTTVPSFGGSRTWSGLQDYDSSKRLTNWVSPALILVGLSEVNFFDFRTSAWWAAALLAAVVGLITMMMDFTMLRTIRDFIFSILAAGISVKLLLDYFNRDPGGDAQTVLSVAAVGLFAITFVLGVLLNVLRTFNIPKLGIGALGAIDVLLFLIFPFNIDILREVPVEVNLLLVVIAAVLGAAAATAPAFLALLGSIAICASAIGVNFYLWFTSEGSTEVDWSNAMLILGTQVGIGLAVGIRGLFKF